jgi:hypothetical protein
VVFALASQVSTREPIKLTANEGHHPVEGGTVAFSPSDQKLRDIALVKWHLDRNHSTKKNPR